MILRDFFFILSSIRIGNKNSLRMLSQKDSLQSQVISALTG